MVQPLIIPRAEHTLSRGDIDPDALKVLYRLHQAGFVAYLVGGSVRDLLIGRRPKDFDIGTNAHPYQIKRLFRNCWIIGRRFRLAHVKFGTKVIEVATFRRQVEPEEPDGAAPEEAAARPSREAGAAHRIDRGDDAPAERHVAARQVHRDNSFGTPEEDAFRRDFTVNALFYDISDFSIIDYVGGTADLRDRVIRSIGDPNVRFLEDPVRMMRAVVLAARLDFRIDAPVLEAIVRHGAAIADAAPPRLMEEYYKVLRSGAALRAFHLLGETGLLRQMSPEVPWPLPHALERSLAELDDYRARFSVVPDAFTNPVLLGSLLIPLGLPTRRRLRSSELHDRSPAQGPRLGALPLARRDLELLEQATAIQARLGDPGNLAPRVQRALMHRAAFRDALNWMQVHGDAPETVKLWLDLLNEAQRPAPAEMDAEVEEGEDDSPWRRPRRRRRRRRGPPSPVAGG